MGLGAVLYNQQGSVLAWFGIALPQETAKVLLSSPIFCSLRGPHFGAPCHVLLGQRDGQGDFAQNDK